MENEPGDRPDDQPERIEAELIIDQETLAGVWANFARVSHSPHEFTLDFIRMDTTGNKPLGLVVARVSVSPLFITQLIDALSDNWDKYAKLALPKEVYADEPNDSTDPPADDQES